MSCSAFQPYAQEKEPASGKSTLQHRRLASPEHRYARRESLESLRKKFGGQITASAQLNSGSKEYVRQMSVNSYFPVKDDNVLSLERVEYVSSYSSGNSTGNGEIYFNRQPTQVERKALEESWTRLGTSSLDLTFSHHVLTLTQTTLWQLYSFVYEIWADDTPSGSDGGQSSRGHSDSLGSGFDRPTGQEIELDWIQQKLPPPKQAELAGWRLREEQLAGVIRQNHASLHRLPPGTMELYRRHKYISWLLGRELKT